MGFCGSLVVWQALQMRKDASVLPWCIGGELFGLGLLKTSGRHRAPGVIPGGAVELAVQQLCRSAEVGSRTLCL